MSTPKRQQCESPNSQDNSTKIITKKLKLSLRPINIYAEKFDLFGCSFSSAADNKAGGSSGLLLDLSANEKAVHAEFFNDFEDLYDDDDLQ